MVDTQKPQNTAETKLKKDTAGIPVVMLYYAVGENMHREL
jgi:hypothetical protein